MTTATMQRNEAGPGTTWADLAQDLAAEVADRQQARPYRVMGDGLHGC